MSVGGLLVAFRTRYVLYDGRLRSRAKAIGRSNPGMGQLLWNLTPMIVLLALWFIFVAYLLRLVARRVVKTIRERRR